MYVLCFEQVSIIYSWLRSSRLPFSDFSPCTGSYRTRENRKRWNNRLLVFSSLRQVSKTNGGEISVMLIEDTSFFHSFVSSSWYRWKVWIITSVLCRRQAGRYGVWNNIPCISLKVRYKVLSFYLFLCWSFFSPALLWPDTVTCRNFGQSSAPQYGLLSFAPLFKSLTFSWKTTRSYAERHPKAFFQNTSTIGLRILANFALVAFFPVQLPNVFVSFITSSYCFVFPITLINLRLF